MSDRYVLPGVMNGDGECSSDPEVYVGTDADESE